MPGLGEMTGEQLAAWVAGDDQGAVASPPDASAPPVEDVAPVTAEAETEPASETPPDIDAVMQELEALKAREAEREAQETQKRTEAERLKAERDAKVAEDLRIAEANEFAKNLRELHEVDPEGAKKLAQHRSFLEQDRQHFMHEAQLNAKMVDAVSIAIETLLPPEQVQALMDRAKSLMPYNSYEDMQGFIGQQVQREQTANERIQQLEAELAEAKRASVAQQRNPAIDQVERSGGSSGPSGAPGRLGSMSGKQLAEWARQGTNATY